MRIGINVPNDLLKRVKALQPDVNISQVCRDALEKLAATHQSAVERVGSDEVALERIAEFADALPVEPDWAGYGWEDAAELVSNITLDDWYNFWELYYEDEKDGRDLTNLVDLYASVVGKHFYTHWSANQAEWGNHRANRRRYAEVLDLAMKEYKGAWLAYVKEVRRRQIESFEVNYQEWLAEREKVWQARPAPEIPPQLLS